MIKVLLVLFLWVPGTGEIVKTGAIPFENMADCQSAYAKALDNNWGKDVKVYGRCIEPAKEDTVAARN